MADVEKCARCSRPLADGDLVTFMHGDWFHLACDRILKSEQFVGEARKRIARAPARLKRSEARLGKRRSA